jgi:hypothetical protein
VAVTLAALEERGLVSREPHASDRRCARGPNLDFRLTVLEDGCRDSDPEVHRVLTEKVFPRQADVLTIDEWVAAVA